MALALYRKYRPRTFAEVIGQEQVTEPLMQALRTGRLNHAYLFSGPRGCGKTSSARILARSLNCAKGPTPEPCGVCDSCAALGPDGPGSIDVIEIDAASHGGVDDARDLREKAFFAPVASRFKVYVIDEAHMVSTQGFNALLKLVEEPPDYVKFIFATTEPEKVLATIKSRTHHYPFRLIPPNVLRPYLEQLCREEGVSVEPAVFPLVVRAGGGSARDALSVLDQLIAGAPETGVTYARAVGLLGVTDVALIDEMTDALAAGDGAAAFATIDRVADAGHDPRRYASDLLERFRDLIILQRLPDAPATGIIEAPTDQVERMATQASRMGEATLSRLADIAHNGLTEMRGTTAPRLLLELIVARMLLPGADESQSALLHRLERMERRLGAASALDLPAPEPVRATHTEPVRAPAAAATAPSAPAASRPPAAAPPPAVTRTVAPPASTTASMSASTSGSAPSGRSEVANTGSSSTAAGGGGADSATLGSLDAAGVRRVWDEVLATVRRRSPRASAVVREAVVRDVRGNEIVLAFKHGVHANMFGSNSQMLAEAVHEVLGGDWVFRTEVGGDDTGTASTRASTDHAPVPTSGSPARGGSGGNGPGGGGSAASGAGGGAASGSGAVDADGWPEPARLGGDGEAGADRAEGGGSSPVAVAHQTAPAAGGRVTARVGSATQSRPAPAQGGRGRANSAGAASGGAASGGAASGGAASGGAGASGGRSGSRAVGAGAASSSASGPAGSGPGGSGSGGSGPGSGAARGRGAAGSGASGRGGVADGRPFDEPPFDPDYDGAPSDEFDPRDEPAGDPATAVAPQSSEEQAIRLLTEQLGAERIGD